MYVSCPVVTPQFCKYIIYFVISAILKLNLILMTFVVDFKKQK